MKKALLVLFAVSALVAYFVFDFGQYLSLENFKSQQGEILDTKNAHPFVFIASFFLIYVTITGLSIPGAAIMTLIAGALFGLVIGTALVSFASTIDARISFFGSRYCFRDCGCVKFGERTFCCKKKAVPV